MNLVAAILILGASGSAERSMESTDSIAGIVGQCLGGLVKDVSRKFGSDTLGQLSHTVDTTGFALRLRIDGQSRDGWRSWGEAAVRVGGYISERTAAGSVGYSYRVRIRGYDIRRETRISDGHVLLTTDAWWTESVPVTKRITRRVPIHVQITITATERPDGVTVLVGTASGNASLAAFDCRLVRRIAERQATAELRGGLSSALAEIERRGRAAYASGSDIADILDGFKLGIEIGGRLRR